MLWKLCLGVALLMMTYGLNRVNGEPSYGQDDAMMHGKPSSVNADLDNEVSKDAALDKRMERYMYGLGRRAYTFTNGGNGMKRLPVYNFGLGKRAQPYSFGLGKRRSGGSDVLTDYVQDDLLTGEDLDHLYNNVYIIDDDEKRNRPYGFGLGKREPQNEDLTHNTLRGRYGFGLGR